jgi:hypothetical protein
MTSSHAAAQQSPPSVVAQQTPLAMAQQTLAVGAGYCEVPTARW